MAVPIGKSLSGNLVDVSVEREIAMRTLRRYLFRRLKAPVGRSPGWGSDQEEEKRLRR
jgi:hypothetical protein